MSAVPDRLVDVYRRLVVQHDPTAVVALEATFAAATPADLADGRPRLVLGCRLAAERADDGGGR